MTDSQQSKRTASSLIEQHRDYLRIKSAIEFINNNPQASLGACAKELRLNPEHFQKLFKRWAGVSPKQYSHFLTKEYAKQSLKNKNSLFETAIQSHLGSTSRLHDIFVKFYGMTPGEYKNEGNNISIEYSSHPSPFGLCLIAHTKKGICKLSFFDTETEKHELIQELYQEWPLANIQENKETGAKLIEQIFQEKTGKSCEGQKPLNILVKGSPFQLKVWEALLNIPTARLTSYSDLANAINKPEATRAVSSAIAKNNIALIIPCHRVIRQSGEFNQYRWGSTRKQALIAWEASQLE